MANWATYVVDYSIEYSMALKIAEENCPKGFKVVDVACFPSEAISNPEIRREWFKAQRALLLYSETCWGFVFWPDDATPTREEVK